MNVLENLRSKVAHRREQSIAEYDALVLAVADGKQIKDDQAEGVLSAASKSVEDLAGDVERIQKRRQWIADLAEEERIKQAAATAEARIEALKAEREHVLERFQAQIAEQAAISQRRVQASTLGNQAREGLRATAPREVVDRLSELRSKTALLRRQTEAAGTAADRSHNDLQELERQLQLYPAENTRAAKQQLAERLAEQTEYVGQCADRRDELRAELAAVEDEIQSLEAQQYAL